MVVGATKSESSERARAERVRPLSGDSLMAWPSLARFRGYFPRYRTVRTFGSARLLAAYRGAFARAERPCSLAPGRACSELT